MTIFGDLRPSGVVLTLCLFTIGWLSPAFAQDRVDPLGVVQFEGVVEPLRESDISPRFDGLLKKITFQPGDIVKKGDLLFQLLTLEQDYTLKLEKAEEQRAKAQLRLAEAELSRAQTLRQRDVNSVAQLEAAEAARDVAAANLRLAATKVEMREIIIREFSLYAPFDGMMRKPLVNEGVYITKNARESSALVVITQLDPIRVTGFVPFQIYAARRAILLTDEATKKGLRLKLILPSGEEYPQTGQIASGGYEFDSETQRILISAIFPNPNLLLRPGLKVTIRSSLMEQQ